MDGQIFLTTGGRRDVFLFFDSPHLPGENQRLTGEVRYEKLLYSQYYGVGNDTNFQEEFTVPERGEFIDEEYYRFQRLRRSVRLDYQRQVAGLKWLAGLSLIHTDVETYSERTLVAEDEPPGRGGGFTNTVKVGVVHDSRDFEPSPSKGDWSEVIVELVDGLLGSDYDYVKLTLTNRHYLPLAGKVVLAARITFERSWGNMPFYEMAFIGGSFRIVEGLGGAKSVRGLLKNRFLGPVKLFGNLEIRRRLINFRYMAQDFYLALSAFYDYGRVWRNGESFTLKGFHAGQGAGLHIGWNENFIIAVDAGRSEEVNLAVYMGFGYLF